MTTNTRSVAIGIFRDRSLAEQALHALRDAGFDRDQILYSGNNGTGFFSESADDTKRGAGSGTTSVHAITVARNAGTHQSIKPVA